MRMFPRRCWCIWTIPLWEMRTGGERWPWAYTVSVGFPLGQCSTPFGTSCGGIHGGGIEMRHLRSRLHGENPSPGGTSRRSVAPELLVAIDASSLIGLAKPDAFATATRAVREGSVVTHIPRRMQASPDHPIPRVAVAGGGRRCVDPHPALSRTAHWTQLVCELVRVGAIMPLAAVEVHDVASWCRRRCQEFGRFGPRG